LNEFLIELQAILNSEISKGNINKSITRLQNQIDKLKLQAEIDPKTIFNLKRQIEKATNQSITFSNINLNNGQIEKTGQQIGTSINKGLMASLGNIKNSIYNVIKEFSGNKLSFAELSKTFNLNRSGIDSSVLEQVRSLTKEINALSKEVIKTGSDSSWENIINKMDSLYIALNKFGRSRDLVPFQESLDILKQFEGKKIFVNNKSELFQNTGMSVRELNNQMRSLNVTFTTSKKNAVDLDTVWSELCNISPNLQNFITFGDQINAIVGHLKTAKEALYGENNLQPVQRNDVSKICMGYMNSLEETANKLNLLREQETEIRQNTVSSTNTIIQNEERKQQAFKQTADIQQKLIANESLIKSGANVAVFDNTNNAAREASQYFKQLLQDENTLISVSEKFNRANELSSFAVNVRRASGEVETLRYALENIGTKGDPFYVFKNIGAELNNSTAIKQVQKMEKVITDYQTKLNDFKTRYSKANIDYSGFETVFNNFKNGIGTVNDLKLAFNQLENAAKMGVQSLKSQSSSLDPITQALNNMRDMPTMLKSLETNMAGLQNKSALTGISVDDLTSRYMKLKTEMDASGGKVPLADGSWAKEYQKLMSDVVSATKRVTAEQSKAEKSTNSLFASFKKNFSFLSYWTSTTYIMMTAIRKIKEMVGNVHELDDALTNIAYTMDVTESQLKQIGESSLQAAKDLHTSVSKVLDAVKTYANATETAESIIEKSKPTIMMSNVTGMDTNQTVDILQGVMEQFDLAEDKLMHISDVMQTVSMSMPYDFANGVKELSEGIKASGSTAKDAGYDLENYTALLGTLIAKTRQSGGELGRSMRTMFVRTTKASTTALANGEVTEDDLSNAEKALRRVGIEVRSDLETFKSFDEIMGELYEKVDSLSDVDLSNIAYEVASTRQTNVFKMMIKAYGDYQEMAERAYNADNVTLVNQEKYAQSLSGKLGELSATWEKIGDEAFSSSFVKGLADTGIGVSSLIEKIGLLKSVIAGVGVAAFVKNFA
jgi:TP901 family phage tail tape measure protein